MQYKEQILIYIRSTINTAKRHDAVQEDESLILDFIA